MNKKQLEQHVGVWSHDLVGRWIAWTVVTPRELRVDLAVGSCTDMAGAIRVGLALMPDVRKITVCEAGKAVQLYIDVDAKWQSFQAGYR